jgi:membrane-associated phospholipid phosphatase
MTYNTSLLLRSGFDLHEYVYKFQQFNEGMAEMTAQREFMSDVTSFGGAPLFLAIIGIAFFLNMNLFWRLLVGIVACYVMVIAIRLMYFRRRPDKSKVRNVLDRVAQSSFPSLHAMRVTVLGVVLIAFFPHVLIRIFVAALILITGYTRVYLKRHYTSDVVAGTILGIIVAGIIVSVI